jgi:hypothetical protein
VALVDSAGVALEAGALTNISIEAVQL